MIRTGQGAADLGEQINDRVVDGAGDDESIFRFSQIEGDGHTCQKLKMRDVINVYHHVKLCGII